MNIQKGILSTRHVQVTCIFNQSRSIIANILTMASSVIGRVENIATAGPIGSQYKPYISKWISVSFDASHKKTKDGINSKTPPI
jgi:hypothetical protein